MDFIERNTERPPEAEKPTPSPLVGKRFRPGVRGYTVQTPVSAVPPQRVVLSNLTPRESAPIESAPLTPHPGPLPQGEREKSASTAKLESLANEILRELRLRREHPQADFSVSKLMAGIVQVITVAILFMAYLNRGDTSLLPLLLFALTLQDDDDRPADHGPTAIRKRHEGFSFVP